jgi:hypothetical protein
MTTLRLVPSIAEARLAWEKRLSIFRSLWDDLNAHPACSTHPENPESERLQADQDALCDVLSASERLLMLTPSPDAAALLEKMDIWWETGGPHRDNAIEAFQAIRMDVERLTTKDR